MIESALTLHHRLAGLGVDALLFNTSELLPSVNLRYLTGFTGSDASVLITPSGRHFFTDGRYKSQASQECPGFRLHVVRRKLDALARALKSEGVRKLGLESSRVSHEFVTMLARKVPRIEMISVAKDFFESFRICKTSEEKEKLQQAAHLASVACRELLDSGLGGKTERDVAEKLEAGFKRLGADGIAFETIVASGTRSALPHGKPGNKVILPGELVIIDYGCRVDGYNSDETVTCVVGSPTSEQRKIHEAVYRAHAKAIDFLKEGVKAQDVDRIARQSLSESGFGKFFLHGLGHGVGLEVHEPPSLSPLGRGVIREGMVFTIEPGVYIEGVGGVRLESLIYMDKSGPELLSEMPKDLIVVS